MPEPREDVLVDVSDGVVSLTWNRAEALNALTPAMLNGAADAIEARSPDVRLVVITGAGRAFSSGAGIGEDPDATLDAANRCVRAIIGCEVPVLAAMNGLAAGVAVSIALAADITVASSSAYLLPAFVNIGLIPDGGATELISAAVGRTRATRLMMLGERLQADEAFAAGLITHVVDEENYVAERDRLTAHLGHGPTRAYREMKRIITQTTLGRLEETLTAESAAQRSLFGTTDQLEGVRAFRERRTPVFTGS